MSSSKSGKMSFAKFCERLNQEDDYRQRYRQDPAALVQQDLGIELTSEQKYELKETVNTIFTTIPNARFFVVGQGSSQSQENPPGGPIFH